MSISKSDLGLLIYTVYQLLTVILLVNLLIAMMGNTYDTVKEEATQQYLVYQSKLLEEYSNKITSVAEIPPFNIVWLAFIPVHIGVGTVLKALLWVFQSFRPKQHSFSLPYEAWINSVLFRSETTNTATHHPSPRHDFESPAPHTAAALCCARGGGQEHDLEALRRPAGCVRSRPRRPVSRPFAPPSRLRNLEWQFHSGSTGPNSSESIVIRAKTLNWGRYFLHGLWFALRPLNHLGLQLSLLPKTTGGARCLRAQFQPRCAGNTPGCCRIV